MQEINDLNHYYKTNLLRKKIQMLEDFRCVRFSVFAKVMTFLHKEITNLELKNIVRQAVEKA